VSVKKALKNKIESISEVSSAGITVYLDYAPQEASLPYAIQSNVGPGTFYADHGGDENAFRETFELDLLHADDETNVSIRNAVIKALNGQGPVTWSGVDVRACTVTDARDLSELEKDGRETYTSRQQIEITIKYRT
jgi:hypothetical protein